MFKRVALLTTFLLMASGIAYGAVADLPKKDLTAVPVGLRPVLLESISVDAGPNTNPTHVYTSSGTYEAMVTVSDGVNTASATLTIAMGSSLAIDVREAKVDSGKKGKVNMKADFTFGSIPAPGDLITVIFDGITLVEEPFGNFKEKDDEPGKYKYKEKNLHVKIDFNKGTIKVSRHKMVLTGIDNSNGIDVVISFGNATGTDHFVMKEKKKKDDDDDNDEFVCNDDGVCNTDEYAYYCPNDCGNLVNNPSFEIDDGTDYGIWDQADAAANNRVADGWKEQNPGIGSVAARRDYHFIHDTPEKGNAYDGSFSYLLQDNVINAQGRVIQRIEVEPETYYDLSFYLKGYPDSNAGDVFIEFYDINGEIIEGSFTSFSKYKKKFEVSDMIDWTKYYLRFGKVSASFKTPPGTDQVQIALRGAGQPENEVKYHIDQISMSKPGYLLMVKDDTDSSSKLKNKKVKFTAKIKDLSTGSLVEGDCWIRFGQDNIHMVLNPSKMKNEFKRSFDQEGLYDWSVSCDILSNSLTLYAEDEVVVVYPAKTLLYSPIYSAQWLDDPKSIFFNDNTLEYWKPLVNGFDFPWMLSARGGYFFKERHRASLPIYKSRADFLARYGLLEGSFPQMFVTHPKAGSINNFPNWFDDTNWTKLTKIQQITEEQLNDVATLLDPENLGAFQSQAIFLRWAGYGGLMIDAESHGNAMFNINERTLTGPDGATYTIQQLKNQVRKRGKEFMEAYTSVYPDIDIIIHPAHAAAKSYIDNDEEYLLNNDEDFSILILDFVKGMIETHSGNVHLMTQRSYDVIHRESLQRIHDFTYNTFLDYLDTEEDKAYFKENASVALATWVDGGRKDPECTLRKSPAQFREVWNYIKTISPKYAIIYQQDGAFDPYGFTEGESGFFDRCGYSEYKEDYLDVLRDSKIN